MLPAPTDIMLCRECGEEMFIDEWGVSYHLDRTEFDYIDWDAHDDHVPIAEEDEGSDEAIR